MQLRKYTYNADSTLSLRELTFNWKSTSCVSLCSA